MKLDPPALFTTTSTWPSWSIAVAAAAATASWLVTSAGITNALRPMAVMDSRGLGEAVLAAGHQRDVGAGLGQRRRR